MSCVITLPKKINGLVFSSYFFPSQWWHRWGKFFSPMWCLLSWTGLCFCFSLLGRRVVDMGLTRSTRPSNTKILKKKAVCECYLWENSSSPRFRRKLHCAAQSYSSFGKTRIMRISCFHPFACIFYLNIPLMAAKCSTERFVHSQLKKQKLICWQINRAQSFVEKKSYIRNLFDDASHFCGLLLSHTMYYSC